MTEVDLFDGFESDEIAAYVFSSEGSGALKELLHKLIHDGVIDRPTLIEMADKLDAAGLSGAVSVVISSLEQLDNEASREIARIMADHVRGNAKGCLASLYRRGGCSLDDLSAAGVDADTLVYVARSRARSTEAVKLS